MMNHFKQTLFVFLCAFTLSTQAQTAKDSTAIIEVVKNYIEGWYDGDTTRMHKAMHPMVSKKSKTGDVLSLDKLLEYTQNCFGCSKDQRILNIEILDYFKVTTPEGNAIFDYATVKCESNQFIDYLHISQTYGEWKIGNVLWCDKTDTLGGTEETLVKTIHDYHQALKTKDTDLLKKVLSNNFRSGKAMCYFLIESIDQKWITTHFDNFTEGFSTSDSINIEIQSMYRGTIAMAKLTSGDKTELVQLAFQNNTWKLVNVYRNYYTKLREVSLAKKKISSNAEVGTVVGNFDSRFHYNPDITYTLPVETIDTIYNENFKIEQVKLVLKKKASEIKTWPQTIRVKVSTVFKDAFYQDFILEKDEVLKIGKTKNSPVDGKMTLFPNPASSFVKISSPKLDKSLIQIYNLQGEEVFSVKQTIGNEAIVKVSNFNSGLYFVKRSTAEQNEVGRLMIK